MSGADASRNMTTVTKARVLQFVAVATLLNIGAATPARAQNFCGTALDGTARISLVTPARVGSPAVLELAEFYGSGALLGTPQVTSAGNQFRIDQSNTILWSAPTTACRVQTIDLGALPAGTYEVTWTTVETLAPPLDPPTRTRVRTFSFLVVGPSAIPTADSPALVLIGLALAIAGVSRLRSV